MTYKTSLDNSAKAITVGITILFAVIIITEYLITKSIGKTIPVIISVVLLLIYLIVFAFIPVSYTLTVDTLVIHRLVSDVHIRRIQIKSVELLDEDKIKWAHRVLGVGGLFGYFGEFANTELGTMTWYATSKEGTVLVQTGGNRIILTPDNPRKFVAEIQRLVCSGE